MDAPLVYNALRTPDGTVIASRHRHDYVSHRDANGKTYVVDGGLAYLRRSTHGDEVDLSLTLDSPFEQIRRAVSWDTYGKDGRSSMKHIALCDMESSHIHNCLNAGVAGLFKALFEEELAWRQLT
jgi:hypothetical protein